MRSEAGAVRPWGPWGGGLSGAAQGATHPSEYPKPQKGCLHPKTTPKIRENGVVGGNERKITPHKTTEKCKHLKFDTKSCAKRIDKGILRYDAKNFPKNKKAKSVNTTQK